ncbi:Zn-ribbon domain-containing OB-fold protein [Saccharopolyspora sp. HNM0983]|uniref:Zn-ribbon domain-containing OB-fold protein n=1 Tax=Saccharopolyspora montiporae TaxID=2781240 RepID=A0A929BE72_9PSEU|nr:Zn-ribbon domain-containing OB-fold protein [Saccharopolyspora sp. HNM0983]MBE9375867.1 Zn-ribbon domain-containing OB-fold protein [Saccharopolyspora sp. HNM0983]
MVGIEADAETRPFWDGVERGELRLQRCADCGRAVFYPRSVCPGCFGQRLDWFTARGTGTVHSWTVAHRAFGAFAGQAPFTVALVDVDEGVRMMTRIVESAQVDIGDRVELRVTRLGGADAPALPCFRVTR